MAIIDIAKREKEGDFHATRYYSSKQESSIAKSLDGVQQINSGATPFAKGDVICDDWLIECKTKESETKSFSIKREWLDKNSSEALFMGKKYNALAFNFGPNTPNYYVLDECTFKELMNMKLPK